VDDPVGGLKWTDDTFVEMTRRAMALADQWCGGRVVSSLEGGYNPRGLASAALAHVKTMTDLRRVKIKPADGVI
jgi:acetoin utilization deacetylase AcuC-like enzyme